MCQEIPDTFHNMLFWTKTIEINFCFAPDTRIRFFLSETVYTSNYVLIRVLLKIVKIIPPFDCMWLSSLLFDLSFKKYKIRFSLYSERSEVGPRGARVYRQLGGSECEKKNISNHPAIQPSNHPAIQPSNHPTIQPSNHPTKDTRFSPVFPPKFWNLQNVIYLQFFFHPNFFFYPHTFFTPIFVRLIFWPHLFFTPTFFWRFFFNHFFLPSFFYPHFFYPQIFKFFATFPIFVRLIFWPHLFFTPTFFWWFFLTTFFYPHFFTPKFSNFLPLFQFLMFFFLPPLSFYPTFHFFKSLGMIFL